MRHIDDSEIIPNSILIELNIKEGEEILRILKRGKQYCVEEEVYSDKKVAENYINQFEKILSSYY